MKTVSSKIAAMKAETFDIIKGEIDKLSPIRRIVFETVFSRIFDLFSSDCSEDELASAVNSLEKVSSEYVKPSDYYNYDEAMEELEYGSNRAGFVALMKKHGIKSRQFKGHKIGFNKAEILALKNELKEDFKRRQKKLNKKETTQSWKSHIV